MTATAQAAASGLAVPIGKVGEDGFTFITWAPITKEMIEHFALATGDRNPIHFSEQAAREAGFDGPIAHAGVVTGFVSRSLLDHFGEGTAVLSIGATKFHKPSYIGERMLCFVRETKRRKSACRTIMKADVQVRINGKTVLTMEDVTAVK